MDLSKISIGDSFEVVSDETSEDVTDSIIDAGFRIKCVGVTGNKRRYVVIGSWMKELEDV